MQPGMEKCANEPKLGDDVDPKSGPPPRRSPRRTGTGGGQLADPVRVPFLEQALTPPLPEGEEECGNRANEPTEAGVGREEAEPE
jgi:hypothetical protein